MGTYTDCMDQIATQVAALSSIDMNSNPVVRRKRPWSRAQIHTGISVHYPVGEVRERQLDGTINCDDFVYPVYITWIRGTGGNETDHVDRIDTFRDEIRGEFNHKRLPPVTQIYQVIVRHGTILLPKQYRDHYEASSMVCLCIARETRP